MKTLIVTTIFFCNLTTHAMEKTMQSIENEIAITKTIESYVQGYLKAEKTLIINSFFDETCLYSVDENKLDQLKMKKWLKNIDDRKQKGDIRTANSEIKFIDVTNDTAVAKLELVFEKFKFTDYLSLLKINNIWKIVGKIYNFESK